MQHLLLSNTNQTAIGVTNRPGPTLDLNFAATKNCIDQVSGRDLITFTRSTTGTYFDSAGVLRSAAVNLLLRSEEFDSAAWTKTRSSITANSAIAPNGTLTADKLVEDTTASATHLVSVSSGIIAGNTYTYSVYAKPAGRDWIVLSPGGSWGFAWFNISSGTIGTVTSGGSSATAAIQSVGNGWYRCSVTATAVDNRGLQILVTTGNNVVTYTGDGTSGVFLWGAQLEQSSTVGEYIPTGSTINSAPRFDHNPLTGESLGLLVEEQRTNLLVRSEELDNASWSKAFATVTANQTTAPDGTSTADKLIGNATIDAHYAQQNISSATSGISYTSSVFAKASELTRFELLHVVGSTLYVQGYDLSNGTLLPRVAAGTTAATGGFIQAVGNGWYRCGITQTSDGTTGAIRCALRSENAVFFDATSQGIFLWGAQLEAGAFPTSYIPTTSATVTRNADVASITGANFSSWYRQEEGTLFTEYRDPGVAGPFRTPCVISDGTANNRIQCFLSGTTTVNNRHIAAGTAANPGTLSAIANSRNRHAIAAAVGSCNAASNGTLSTASAPAAMPVVNRLNIGRNADSTGDYLNASIARIIYYPVRIPNAILQAITI